MLKMVARYLKQRRRMRNVEKFRQDLLDPRAEARALPLNLYYEPTAYCNLKCKTCYRETTPGFADNQHMPEAIYETFRLAYPDALSVMLLGWGEPLIFPRLSEHLDDCKQAGIMTMTSTNGVLLADGKREALLSGTFSLINISIDATTPETYQRIRCSDAFEAVCENVRDLAGERARRGMQYPILAISFCLTEENKEDYPALPRLVKELGADHVITQRFEPDVDFEGHPDLQMDEDELGVLVQAARAECAELGLSFFINPHAQPPDMTYREVHKELPADWKEPPLPGPPRYYCESLWRMMASRYDGRVVPCCPRLNTIMGDLSTQSVEEVWNGPAYRLLRWELLAGQHPPICEKCPERRPVDPEAYLEKEMAWVSDLTRLTARTL